ncbi:MAG: YbhB/YbcL family Raf kinase inhibitor-like protein [Lachnospiraceae bacterium]|jgi:phosphatidylethanolamine-binding protein (PEBP) family uncharacterized protein|nr:YbhB/YbcL family Raf kinase inhibitor-like protein [Lachnospiraceae bacterium]MEE3461629.1 YbhB/YbcL family Raf kinase inhibitor-like protein [Lachnospiraceae bacterium]
MLMIFYKINRKACLALIIFAGVCSLIVTGCGKKAGEKRQAKREEIKEMNVSSKDIHDGVWDTKITNTAYGKNVSPALKFDPVDGATFYAVYMVDPDGSNWLHWRLFTKKTELETGEDDGEYIGPYPPAGTHRYIVKVYALKKRPDSRPGNFDASGETIDKIREMIDISDGFQGNILGEGELVGTYTAGDR